MTFLSKPFWRGFLLGSGVFLAVGIVGVNAAFKISYINQSLSVNDTVQPHAIALLDSGEIDGLRRHLRSMAFSDFKRKQFFECMADKWWFLSGTKSERACFRVATSKMPGGWSPKATTNH